MIGVSKDRLVIWGRANSVNVQKVLWCCEELRLAFDRIDAGRNFGRNREPEYLAMNPSGRVPTLIDGDFILWESNTILRYLAAKYGEDDALYPVDLRRRALIDKWLDWAISSCAPVTRDLYWGIVRAAAEKRDVAAMQRIADRLSLLWQVLENSLGHCGYAAGDAFSIADICLGAYARRWFGFEEVVKPPLPKLAAWFARINFRSGFQHYLTDPMT